LSASPGESVDGRTARAERTRLAVVDATLALLGEGRLRPSAAEIAARAGVSPRSVFQHFEDLDALHAAVAERQLERIHASARRISPEGPLAERVAAFTEQRAHINEMITPVRRAGMLAEPFAPEIALRLMRAREWGRRECANVFAPELARLRAADARELLAALTMASSWSAWESMRAHQGLTAAQARRVMSRTLTALLAAATSARTGRSR
ncbi:MAG TPA: TetR/AcrR family transcriptional regulator, partial [Dehalococcoidia bacterium]|nr:TetR/AcrR family transcriptional regulator [Dehalococcoidia bacterium]